jgi:uncharacterized membrane protein
VDVRAGIIASLAWAWAMLLHQFTTSRKVSGLLIITAATLTIRCVTWVVHQSTFTYFAVPVAETVAMSLLFIGTLAIGKPLLVSLARDFVPSLGDHLGTQRYRKVVRNLSMVWGGVYLGSAASSGLLLSTQSLHWFLLLHQLSGWFWTGSGLAISILYGRRNCKDLIAIAHAGLHRDPAPTGPVPAIA